ncbi:MAG: type II secretion system F family protein [Candidatus Dormibacteria bacterium]
MLLTLVGGAAVFSVVLSLLGNTQAAEGSLARLEGYLDGGAGGAPGGEPRQTPHAVPPTQALRAAVRRFGGARVDRSERGSKLAARLMRAGLKLRPGEWLALSLAVSLLVGGLSFLRFASPFGGVIGAAVGYGGAQYWLKRRISKNRRKFDQQLGPAVLSISNGVKAGYTFAQAIDLVGKNAPMPIGVELMRVTREVQLGLAMQEALGHMVERNESDDLRLMLTAVQIQQQVGGNLASILDTIEFTIRERVRIKGEIRTLTGQARASGWILIILPFALSGILQVIAPTYFGPMFKSAIGQGMLGAAAFSLLCGYGIIQKIVNIQV